MSDSKLENVIKGVALMRGPGFWRNETSGILAPVVEDYINGRQLDAGGISTLRAYLRQWICADVWDMFPIGGSPTPELTDLRRAVDGLTTQRAIRDWLWKALEIGIDPL